MNENLTITKEQLVSLLKAAHAAYKGEMKPPHSPTSDWASWYADYVVNQLKKSASPDASKINPSRTSTNKISTGKLPDLPDSPSETTGFKDIKPQKPEPAAANPAAIPPKTGGASNTLQVCPTCAHRNRPGILFCENCGTNLVTGAQTAPSTRDLREPQENAATSTNISKAPDKTQEADKPKLDETEAQAVRTAGSSIFNADMLLRIEVEGGATPIIIKPKAEDMILGRRDPTTGATPEVDLTSYAGYRMGVSRRHASLALENSRLNLWDLGSSNGTFVNGTRLTPHQPSPLRDGDEIRLGQMVLHLFFQKGPSNT